MSRLFEEAILHESRQVEAMLDLHAGSHPEAPHGYFPGLGSDPVGGPDHYLAQLEATLEAVDVPVMASLNGVSHGGWIRYAE